MAKEMEAVLNCGDVVTEWSQRREGDKVHWTRCPVDGCDGKWRVVKEIRPRA